MEATTRAWEEKNTDEADRDTFGVISASISDGGDFNSFLETVLSDCDESLEEEPTTPPEEEVEEGKNNAATSDNRRGAYETQHDAFPGDDDVMREGRDHEEDGARTGRGKGATADVRLLAGKDCPIGTYVPGVGVFPHTSTLCTYDCIRHYIYTACCTWCTVCT